MAEISPINFDLMRDMSYYRPGGIRTQDLLRAMLAYGVADGETMNVDGVTEAGVSARARDLARMNPRSIARRLDPAMAAFSGLDRDALLEAFHDGTLPRSLSIGEPIPEEMQKLLVGGTPRTRMAASDGLPVYRTGNTISGPLGTTLPPLAAILLGREASGNSGISDLSYLPDSYLRDPSSSALFSRIMRKGGSMRDIQDSVEFLRAGGPGNDDILSGEVTDRRNRARLLSQTIRSQRFVPDPDESGLYVPDQGPMADGPERITADRRGTTIYPRTSSGFSPKLLLLAGKPALAKSMLEKAIGFEGPTSLSGLSMARARPFDLEILPQDIEKLIDLDTSMLSKEARLGLQRELTRQHGGRGVIPVHSSFVDELVRLVQEKEARHSRAFGSSPTDVGSGAVARGALVPSQLLSKSDLHPHQQALVEQYARGREDRLNSRPPEAPPKYRPFTTSGRPTEISPEAEMLRNVSGGRASVDQANVIVNEMMKDTLRKDASVRLKSGATSSWIGQSNTFRFFVVDDLGRPMIDLDEVRRLESLAPGALSRMPEVRDMITMSGLPMRLGKKVIPASDAEPSRSRSVARREAIEHERKSMHGGPVIGIPSSVRSKGRIIDSRKELDDVLEAYGIRTSNVAPTIQDYQASIADPGRRAPGRITQSGDINPFSHDREFEKRSVLLQLNDQQRDGKPALVTPFGGGMKRSPQASKLAAAAVFMGDPRSVGYREWNPASVRRLLDESLVGKEVGIVDSAPVESRQLTASEAIKEGMILTNEDGSIDQASAKAFKDSYREIGTNARGEKIYEVSPQGTRIPAAKAMSGGTFESLFGLNPRRVARSKEAAGEFSRRTRRLGELKAFSRFHDGLDDAARERLYEMASRGDVEGIRAAFVEHQEAIRPPASRSVIRYQGKKVDGRKLVEGSGGEVLADEHVKSLRRRGARVPGPWLKSLSESASDGSGSTRFLHGDPTVVPDSRSSALLDDDVVGLVRGKHSGNGLLSHKEVLALARRHRRKPEQVVSMIVRQFREENKRLGDVKELRWRLSKGGPGMVVRDLSDAARSDADPANVLKTRPVQDADGGFVERPDRAGMRPQQARDVADALVRSAGKKGGSTSQALRRAEAFLGDATPADLDVIVRRIIGSSSLSQQERAELARRFKERLGRIRSRGQGKQAPRVPRRTPSVRTGGGPIGLSALALAELIKGMK